MALEITIRSEALKATNFYKIYSVFFTLHEKLDFKHPKMRFVFYSFMVNLSFVLSATISEWDDDNPDMPESFESVQDIMSYLENNYWKDTKKPYDDFVTSNSRPVNELDQVDYLLKD